MSEKEVIDILESYHACQESEADAMDFQLSAQWHKQVAKWLREHGMEIIEKAKKNVAEGA